MIQFSLFGTTIVYTATFAEYYTAGRLIPVTITADDLATFVATEQISLELSPVMLLDGMPVGLVTVGLRDGRSAYCRGFGIVPSARGKKLGVALSSVHQDDQTGGGGGSCPQS
jgi:hypothetical protein